MIVVRAVALPRGLAIRTYPIPTFKAPIPLLGECSGWIGKPVTISWDESKTTVTGARLVINRVHSDRDPIDLKVNFNGVEARHFFWGEGTKCTDQSDIVDVVIVNGFNKFEARACKHYFWPGFVKTTVSAYVEVTFEGETPERPWWEYLEEWVEANLFWIVFGVPTLFALGSVVMYVTKETLKT